MAVRDTFVDVNNGDQLDDGYFNGIGATAPQSLIILPFTGFTAVSGGWTSIINTNAMMNRMLLNGAGSTVGDEVSFGNFVLAPGTYTLYVYHAFGGSHGILTFYIDDVSIGTIDEYAAVTSYAAESSITSITISTGAHSLKAKLTGKNASSGNYYTYTSLFVFIKTG